MSFTLELFDTPGDLLVLAESKRVPRPGGRIAVVGILKKEGHGVVFHLCVEGTHSLGS
jgi:hypothetical protein